MGIISQHTLDFLNALAANNDRDWFNTHKPDYEKSYLELIDFTEQVLQHLARFDELVPASGKKSLYRIYRDIRFSKDKSPYKTYWGGFFKRAGAHRRGGYSFHIEPGNSFISGGFFGPNKEDLFHLRSHIAADDRPLREVFNSSPFQVFFGQLKGQQLKTAPRGFDADHKAVDLLRHKQFIISHQYSDAEVLSHDFEERIAEGFSNMLPFFNAMTEYLTTNLNGAKLI